MSLNGNSFETLFSEEGPKLKKLKLHGLDFNGTDILAVLGKLV